MTATSQIQISRSEGVIDSAASCRTSSGKFYTYPVSSDLVTIKLTTNKPPNLEHLNEVDGNVSIAFVEGEFQALVVMQNALQPHNRCSNDKLPQCSAPATPSELA